MTQARVRFDQPSVGTTSSEKICASWRVSRAAMSRAKPGVMGPGKTGQVAVLAVSIMRVGEGWQTEVVLEDPRLETRHVLSTSAASVEITIDGELTHVEAPGVLSATFRGERLVFARTPVLGELGLLGGRYELGEGSIK